MSHKHCIFCGEPSDVVNNADCYGQGNTMPLDTSGHRSHVYPYSRVPEPESNAATLKWIDPQDADALLRENQRVPEPQENAAICECGHPESSHNPAQNIPTIGPTSCAYDLNTAYPCKCSANKLVGWRNPAPPSQGWVEAAEKAERRRLHEIIREWQHFAADLGKVLGCISMTDALLIAVKKQKAVVKAAAKWEGGFKGDADTQALIRAVANWRKEQGAKAKAK